MKGYPRALKNKQCATSEKIYLYSGGWNTKRVLNSNGHPLFGFPMAFRFEQNGGHFLWISNGSVFQVKTIAIAIAMTNHSKTEPLEM